MGRIQVAAFALLTACGGSDATSPDAGKTGSVALDLELPPAGDLRPTGMTTVAVAVTTTAGVETVTTTPLTGMMFSAGDVTVGTEITIGAELHDNTNRLVGFGRNLAPITPDATDQTVRIDVRKPYVYVSSTGPIATIDTTLDALDAKYQGALASSGTLAVPIDGTEIAVISGTTLQRVTTDDHKATGGGIDIKSAALDAAAVPGKRQVVVATANALVLVDIDAGTAMSLPISAKPDRVAVGGSASGGYFAYVLSSRVAPPQGATGTCSGSSTVTKVALDGSGNTAVGAAAPLSDIAAAGGAVFGANPCSGTVSRLDGGDPKVSLQVPGAASVAIEGVRVWAAGSTPNATSGAQITLASVQLDGSDPQTVKLAGKSEIMTYDGDGQKELAIDMHADTEVPVDMTVLPGAQTVALIARMDTHREARGDQFGDVIPAMTAVVHDLVIADTKTGALRRIRENCTLQLNSTGAEFQSWSCGTVTADEAPASGQKVPSAVSAIYGGR